jgi:protein-tyrosine kinase
VSTKRYEIKKKLQRLQLDEDSVSTEQIRMIRTNVEQVSEGKPSLYMLTSPNYDGERSIISAKLAISFVEQGKKVLLVDANIRKPSLHNWFQITNDSGLTDVILNNNDIQHHLKETFFPGLFILPTGPSPLNLSEIWVTSKIKELARKCESEYNVVIFEAPPYLTVSDSQILASQCDGVILVITANKTKKEDALKTKELLERTNNRVAGVIYHTG